MMLKTSVCSTTVLFQRWSICSLRAITGQPRAHTALLVDNL
jgi:hypothetical protein